jgi:hypothetical protein
MTMGEFNTPLLPIYRSTGPKVKETSELKATIDLTDIYRECHSAAA